jgi:hypothetical protein
MHHDPHTLLALHRAHTERAAADPRWTLPRRARPPGRLRAALATVLRRTADALATERQPDLPALTAGRR